MTLRLRRGTDLERQAITFQEGELVYITDTKDLYAGDGTTVGGIKVSNIGSPSSLTQNLNLNGYSIQGSGTISATSFTGDGSGLTNVGVGVVPGTTYEINVKGDVLAQDGTLLVDSLNEIIYGTFVGDGSGLTGVIVPGNIYEINVKGDVLAQDDTVLVDNVNKLIYGTFVGDVSLNIGEDYNINIRGSVIGSDSSLIVDADTNSLYGTFVGDGSLLQNVSLDIGEEYVIDIKGNVRGTDDSLIIDTVTNDITGNDINGNIITASDRFVGDAIEYNNNIFTFDSTGGGGFPTVLHRATDGTNTIAFERISSTIVNPGSPQFLGQITFNISDPTPQELLRGVIYSFEESILIAAGVPGFSTTQYANNQYLHLKDDSLCIGGLGPVEKLDVRGNGIFSGDVSAAAFKGSLMADDSTTIIDGISGNITAPGYIQFGSFSKIDRDSLAASNGFVIYNTTSNRFQGFQNNAWINLDDGTADP
jgi:hypothetical protein